MEIILCGKEGFSNRRVEDKFNMRHPEWEPVLHIMVDRLLEKLYRTGSVADTNRSDYPSTSEWVGDGFLAKIKKNQFDV